MEGQCLGLAMPNYYDYANHPHEFAGLLCKTFLHELYLHSVITKEVAAN